MASIAPGRRQSTRAVRTSTTRPANYYARPFGVPPTEQPPSRNNEPGFFPAITHFTDSVTALPKEVISHLSMLKEVDAKIHNPEQELLKLADTIDALPPAQRYQPTGLTAAHSLAGSANGSVNGNASPATGQYLGREIQSSQPRAEDLQTADMNLRRQLMFNLCFTINHLNPILDEKIAVLATANESLKMQLERMDSSYRYIDQEISEEARLGSLTHWAYIDRESKKSGAAAGERSRRDAAGVHALASAAAAHEGEPSSRSEARREAMMAKKHRNQHVDSDFDDRPPAKKPHGNKGRKHGETAEAKIAGLGVANGAAPPKRRKVEKGQPMERSISGAMAQIRGNAASPRETPGSDFAPVKRKKPGPAPGTTRKRPQPLNANSPQLASSPLQPGFPAGTASRPNATRARQNSQANVLSEKARPPSSASNRPPNGSATPALKPVDDVTMGGEETMSGALPPGAETLKREETDAHPDDTATAQEADSIPAVTMTTRGARASKTATPIVSTFPGDALNPRVRSTRNNGNGGSAGTAAADANGAMTSKRGHKRGAASIAQSVHAASGANSRRASIIADGAPEVDATAAIALERTSSRPQRNRKSAVHEDEAVDVNDEEDVDMEGEDAEGEEIEGSEEGEDGEPRYCFCNEVSYGTMVGCDGDDCEKQWFHLSCVGLREAPKSDETWYCADCLGKNGKRVGSRQ
ncbi:hypothetical protein NA57DRAFT_51481 [Rhizodiscina lignyota]|uniref:Chromatin modification-related protein n=1 Tax=Rhizodiscina lignyota TaxID=1504668 RepID=A0A9P4MEP0_9PEZI|nr:hypothetical protein NA57DRAFT_51481 [Rhizodiscina lignyota]